VIQPIVPTCVCRSALLDNQCHSTKVRPPPDLKKIDKTLVTIASCTHDVEMPRRISYPHRLERACPASLTHTDKNGCLALNTSIRPLSLHWRMKLAAAGVRSEALIGWWVSKCDTTGKPDSLAVHRKLEHCEGARSLHRVGWLLSAPNGLARPVFKTAAAASMLGSRCGSQKSNGPSPGYKLANDDTRARALLGHRNLQSAARYRALAATRLVRFWQH
jgi:hypothetical protein